MSSQKRLGAESKYKEKYCEMLIEHMAQGLSYESFAGTIGVNRDTLYEWQKKFPEFDEAKKHGRDKSLLFWESLGIKNIINRSEGVPGGGINATSLNATVYRLNMINRFQWKDKADVEANINVDVSLSDKISKARARLKKGSS